MTQMHHASCLPAKISGMYANDLKVCRAHNKKRQKHLQSTGEQARYCHMCRRNRVLQDDSATAYVRQHKVSGVVQADTASDLITLFSTVWVCKQNILKYHLMEIHWKDESGVFMNVRVFNDMSDIQMSKNET